MAKQRFGGGWMSARRAAMALVLGAALPGCISNSTGLMDEPPRPKARVTLSASQFHDPQAAAMHAEPAPTATPDGTAGTVEPGSAQQAVTGSIPPTNLTAPANPIAETIPAVVSHAGLVGQVNGRPIYVSEFFAPIENELRILGRDKTREEFIIGAYDIIQRQLAELIKNELVYAEAEAALTENERVGIRHFLRQLEGDLTRDVGRKASDRRFREEKGLGVDEVIELERRRQLILYKVHSEIEKRVIVSWRDVQRYYRDHQAEFNPPASIQLRLLAVAADDAALRAEIEKSLADGYLFSTLAEQYSTILASRGGLMEPTVLGSGLADTALTAWPQVDAIARTLEKGQYGGPVIVGERAIWVYVENHSDGAGRSLYDVQLEIQKKLHDERYREEERKYLAELFARGNMDDFDNMAILLLDIAMQRWAAPE